MTTWSKMTMGRQTSGWVGRDMTPVRAPVATGLVL